MSSQRAALIAGIRAAPDDDAPRLVCADWFEEQGDEANVARAEFIRVQIERARLPVDDVRHSELQARELRLLKRYAPVWCGSHFVFKKARFRRGFIEGVHLHLQHFLHHRRQMLTLEPVRDVRLTGWYRAPADLLRRVAGCEELEEIETLRIHHQGPHKDPHSDLLILLESPHWRRLRALHGTFVAFNADARRRFERLPVLRQITELVLPTLDTYPDDPGEWFSDGGAAFAEQWGELRSFTFPYYLSLGLLDRITAMPWWGRLTRIELVVSYPAPEALLLLRDRLPRSLQELHLRAAMGADGLEGLEALESFLDQLGQAPLRALHLHPASLSAEALGRLLAGTNRWQLQELHLSGGDLSAAHARVLASSPGAANLLSLGLPGHFHDERLSRFDSAASKALFSSRSLTSLVHLSLNGRNLGPEGARALAGATEWGRLRSLDVSATGLRSAELRALLASPNLRGLNWLAVGEPSLEISPDLARAITELPHLAHLQLGADMGARSKEILSASEPLAWQYLPWESDDVQYVRAMNAPDRAPPLDTALDGGPRGR
jgi:uncharacterized protein (TIGR02996 family)